MAIVLAALLFHLTVFAGETCPAPNTASAVDDVIPVFDAISWNHWAVSATEMDRAPCKTKTVPDYEEYLADESDRELETAFRDMVPSGQFPDGCATVICAVDKLWGPELGRKLLFMKLRHGYNGSEYAYPRHQRFTLPQLNEVLKALNDLPPALRKLGWQGNQKLTIPPPGVRHPRVPTATADSAINLYENWTTTSSTYIRQYALFHELAHNLGDSFYNQGVYLSDSEDWARVKNCFVSNYGNTNASENLAESLTKYRYNGLGLKQTCPQKYEFLRTRVFGGVEYTDPTLCPP